MRSYGLLSDPGKYCIVVNYVVFEANKIKFKPSDFCKTFTEFYQISLKKLPYLTDFSPQLMLKPGHKLDIRDCYPNSMIFCEIRFSPNSRASPPPFLKITEN